VKIKEVKNVLPGNQEIDALFAPIVNISLKENGVGLVVS
jgi:hypothetical protein